MSGVRLGGITLPDFDAEALETLVMAAIDELPDTQKPRAEDEWSLHLTLNPQTKEVTAVLLWDFPFPVLSY